MGDAIRRASKLHFDEIDCKTVWTPSSVTWKRHISRPKTIDATIEMMKKDAAYQLASGTAQWWVDLTNNGWFDAPEAAVAIRKLEAIEERLQDMDRCGFGEIALVVSQRSMMFQAPREGLHNATQLMFRNWHLSRVGAPFEQLLLSDLARPDLPAYKLYIIANVFYASDEDRKVIDRVAKRNGATVLWVYAPGFLDDRCASLEKTRHREPGDSLCLHKKLLYRTSRVPTCPATSASTSSGSISGRFWGMVNFSAAMALP